jgi:hypothetical protein
MQGIAVPSSFLKKGNIMKTEFKKSHLSLVINNKGMELKNEIGNFRQLSPYAGRQPKRFSWVLLLLLGLWTVTMLASAEAMFRYRYITLNDSLLPPGFFFFNSAGLIKR